MATPVVIHRANGEYYSDYSGNKNNNNINFSPKFHYFFRISDNCHASLRRSCKNVLIPFLHSLRFST